MSETQRKLTTIFSADVQDYTRLMGLDEEGTLATLNRYRDAMSGLITAHGGRVVNTWGDGLIAEFPSVVEAVRAAVDVQTELAAFNDAKPASAQMLFRIGINLGDVIADGSDIYGDGVNIAARLQASAPAGGIVISSTVYDQVRNKVPVGFDFLGPPGARPQATLRLRGKGQPHEVKLATRLQSEYFPFLAQAAREGAGVALLPAYIVRPDLEAGRLLQVLPAYQTEGPGDKLYILTSPTPYPSSAQRALVDFLKRELEPLLRTFLA